MPKLTWYGHSAFQLEDDAGNIVIIVRSSRTIR